MTAKTIHFATNDAIEQFKQLKAEREELNARVKEAAVEALKAFCTGIFARHPEIEQFTWVQYGGEYNDEGPYYGVNNIAINDEDVTEAIYDYRRGGAAKQIHEDLLALFGEDLLMDVFETRVSSCDQITVTHAGVSVEYYEGG